MRDNELYIGIDAGSVSINCIILDSKRKILYEHPYERHFGQVEKAIHEILSFVYKKYDENKIQSLSFTGTHGKYLAEITGSFYEFESICQILGAIFIMPKVKTIISMGGQDTALFQISNRINDWELEHFNTNGPCAAGTGSFIDQQAKRLADSIYTSDTSGSKKDIDNVLGDLIKLGLKSESPADVACRCTVFTKSDMIHLQNKGEKLEDIIYGLHIGNARNYMSTIVNNRSLEEPIIFIGGLSLNEIQIVAFKKYFPNLIIPKYSTSIGALGVAFQSLKNKVRNQVNLKVLDKSLLRSGTKLPYTSRLILKKTVFPSNNNINDLALNRNIPAYLGIDIGSTTTKYALVDSDKRIIHKNYIHTQGKPIETTQTLLKSLKNDIGSSINIEGVATTGSGRNVVGDFLNADLILDEITAHARGAVEIDRDIDTIFEIGGQDSKYISIIDGFPLDFDMNKVCAAGTGSFLHELANKHNINIVNEFQEIALSSENPIKLAERCTVFMESDLVSYHQKGALEKDLIAGLCYSIVHNYLNRVVGKRKIGKKIMFLGGPSLNKAIVAAFENVLQRGLIVPKHREVLGAFGAAISVQREGRIGKLKQTSFRGFDSSINDQMKYKQKTCRVDPDCHNKCKLKIYSFDGRKSVWGGDCGRYETNRNVSERKEDLFQYWEDKWESFMEGLYIELGAQKIDKYKGRPTIGMQRCLYTFKTGIFWANFFNELGFRLVLTPYTNNRISSLGVESVNTETCYPTKVSFGHIKELIDKTRYLFLPVIVDMQTPNDCESGYFCPLIQSNQFMLKSALGLDENKLINPIVHFKYDINTLYTEISGQISKKLDLKKFRIKSAVKKGIQEQNRFEQEIYDKGKEILENIQPHEPLAIVTGRSYNLYDKRLNLGIGKNLSKIGISALPMDFINIGEIDLSDFPSMYWGLGAQILRTAKFISNSPNYFGLHITNFSCGPDSFLEHFYKHTMEEKPYLILELDEHSASAGIMTRIEAFKNVIDNCMQGASFQKVKIENEIFN